LILKKLRAFLKNNKGISFGLITLFFLLFFYFIPELAISFYHGFLFYIIRYALDYSVSLLPFPIFPILLIVIALKILVAFKRSKNWKERLIVLPVNIIGWIFGCFMWLWGFNYCCPSPFSEHDAPAINEKELFQLGVSVSDTFKKYDDHCFTQQIIPLKTQVQGALIQFFDQNKIPTPGKPRFYSIGMNGIMRRLGVAGIYMPFSGQAHGDASFPVQTNAFINVHELAHAYGITAESDADYSAFMALKQVTSQEMQFAADFELFRSIRSQLHFMNDSLRTALDSMQDERTLALLSYYRKNADSYPQWMPGVSETMNDHYLKLMGVEDGIKNYDHFIDMIWINRAELYAEPIRQE
jgi:hypothetical protein